VPSGRGYCHRRVHLRGGQANRQDRGASLRQGVA